VNKILASLVLVLSLLASCRAQEPQPDSPIVKLLAANMAAPTSVTITVFGEINDELAHHVASSILQADLAPGSEPTYIVIDSGGGSVKAAGEIISAMELSTRHKIITVDIGEAASAAAIIWSYGERRVMWPHAVLMFHLSYGKVEGTQAQMASSVEMQKSIIAIYESHAAKLASLTAPAYHALCADEWWMNAQQAKAAHFATAIDAG
jgi:ATP-dependent protease ClpP protease subunit